MSILKNFKLENQYQNWARVIRKTFNWFFRHLNLILGTWNLKFVQNTCFIDAKIFNENLEIQTDFKVRFSMKWEKASEARTYGAIRGHMIWNHRNCPTWLAVKQTWNKRKKVKKIAKVWWFFKSNWSGKLLKTRVAALRFYFNAYFKLILETWLWNKTFLKMTQLSDFQSFFTIQIQREM